MMKTSFDKENSNSGCQFELDTTRDKQNRNT